MEILRISSNQNINKIMEALNRYRRIAQRQKLVMERRRKTRPAEPRPTKQMREMPEVLQLVNPDVAVSKRQVRIAYKRAVESMRYGYNRSKNIHNEFLLWLAGEAHVNKAISIAGVKDAKNMLLFSSASVPQGLLREIGARIKPLGSGKHRPGKSGLCKIWGMYNRKLYSVEETALERMAWAKALRTLKI